MKRYNVPRLAFINKLDRSGANPFKVTEDVRDKLKLNAALVQVPVGLEADHKAVVDIVQDKVRGETLYMDNFILFDDLCNSLPRFPCR